MSSSKIKIFVRHLVFFFKTQKSCVGVQELSIRPIIIALRACKKKMKVFIRSSVKILRFSWETFQKYFLSKVAKLCASAGRTIWSIIVAVRGRRSKIVDVFRISIHVGWLCFLMIKKLTAYTFLQKEFLWLVTLTCTKLFEHVRNTRKHRFHPIYYHR